MTTGDDVRRTETELVFISFARGTDYRESAKLAGVGVEAYAFGMSGPGRLNEAVALVRSGLTSTSSASDIAPVAEKLAGPLMVRRDLVWIYLPKQLTRAAVDEFCSKHLYDWLGWTGGASRSDDKRWCIMLTRG